MRVPYSRPLAAGCAVLAVVALGITGIEPQLRGPAFAIAFAALMVGATAASHANEIAGWLGGYTGKAVGATVWGTALPAVGCEGLVLEAVFAIFAGLHLRFVGESSGRTYRLKVAQPTDAVLDGARFQIGDARYVQWERARLGRMAQSPALLLRLTE
jgi:hypothetical protein